MNIEYCNPTKNTLNPRMDIEESRWIGFFQGVAYEEFYEGIQYPLPFHVVPWF